MRNLNLNEDIKYCLTPNQTTVIPVYKDGALVKTGSMSIAENLKKIKQEIGDNTLLVAVSKYSSNEEIMEAYKAGQRHFGENKAQDLDAKRQELPTDIHWHFIGHLQRNKVKYIAGYIYMVHAVDSLKLLKEINKEAGKAKRTIPCLLQMHIAKEESKFGLDEKELQDILQSDALGEMRNVEICGLMGMATNTDKTDTVKTEFKSLKTLMADLQSSSLPANVRMQTLSMGMSGDYKIALAEGSNAVRIGSALFKS